MSEDRRETVEALTDDEWLYDLGRNFLMGSGEPDYDWIGYAKAIREHVRAALEGQQSPARIDPLQDPMRPGYFMNYAEDETPAEMVLRKLACWLGVGGYNAPKVDAEAFHRKIVEGVQMLLAGQSQSERAEPVGPCSQCEGEGRIDDPERCLRCGRRGCRQIECPACGGTGATPQSSIGAGEQKLTPQKWRDICNAAGSETDALDEEVGASTQAEEARPVTDAMLRAFIEKVPGSWFKPEWHEAIREGLRAAMAEEEREHG